MNQIIDPYIFGFCYSFDAEAKAYLCSSEQEAIDMLVRFFEKEKQIVIEEGRQDVFAFSLSEGKTRATITEHLGDHINSIEYFVSALETP